MYRLTGVTKEYGHGAVLALRDVDLTLADGEWLAVRGPTGHGKSTLLQVMGGLDTAVVDRDLSPGVGRLAALGSPGGASGPVSRQPRAEAEKHRPRSEIQSAADPAP